MLVSQNKIWFMLQQQMYCWHLHHKNHCHSNTEQYTYKHEEPGPNTAKGAPDDGKVMGMDWKCLALILTKVIVASKWWWCQTNNVVEAIMRWWQDMQKIHNEKNSSLLCLSSQSKVLNQDSDIMWTSKHNLDSPWKTFLTTVKNNNVNHVLPADDSEYVTFLSFWSMGLKKLCTIVSILACNRHGNNDTCFTFKKMWQFFHSNISYNVPFFGS